MTASLTLNKITAQKGISIAEAANRVADLGWTPSYVQEAMTFPTDYKISKTPRDPMKQVLRSYFPIDRWTLSISLRVRVRLRWKSGGPVPQREEVAAGAQRRDRIAV